MMTEQKQTDSGQTQAGFEQTLTSAIAREFLKEQRRSRRWSIFFKLLFACYLLGFFAIYLSQNSGFNPTGMGGDKHTALIDISGAIGADTDASADNIISGIRAAYENEKTAGIILRINSPGGSPVQAGYVNDEIYRLRALHPNIPVYAVISDICASGGYYIASAAENIYADKASLVGSIGVIMSGFGFVDTIQKLGIERRVRHAGENKSFMDPFVPLKEDEVAHVDMMLNDIYEQFKAVVIKGRGERLKVDDKIFSGLIWTGDKAIQLGLVDALGSSSQVARDIIGAENIVNFTYKPGYLDKFAGSLGASVAQKLLDSINIKLN